ncbi:MAG: hypothetical protein CBE00_03740 [Planctomycetaceae bacterium TMED240]|nr:hypothetical protein [Rhodopirellula sp.]OUX07771.1 MAG: hypothetical protein CBE00_03740 [Planctomycetaceae bacterium TMED240]
MGERNEQGNNNENEHSDNSQDSQKPNARIAENTEFFRGKINEFAVQPPNSRITRIPSMSAPLTPITNAEDFPL